MTGLVIEATNVVKYLGSGAGRVAAVRGISLSLTGGQLALLMGPSGSGKTTLLSMLGCMLTPTSGTVRILGQVTAGLLPERLADLRRRHVGFIFQNYHLFPTLTAALDSANGHAIMTLLAKIAKDPSRAVLIVTHDPRVLPFADRVVNIEDGRLVDKSPQAKPE